MKEFLVKNSLVNYPEMNWKVNFSVKAKV